MLLLQELGSTNVRKRAEVKGGAPQLLVGRKPRGFVLALQRLCSAAPQMAGRRTNRVLSR